MAERCCAMPESGIGEPAGGRKAALSPVLMSKVSEKSVTVQQVAKLLTITCTDLFQILLHNRNDSKSSVFCYTCYKS